MINDIDTSKAVKLGEITVPSGELLILDPGLARFWRHDEEPSSPRESDVELFDLRVVGPDALAAGTEYDRQYDPRYMFDVPDVEKAQAHFENFCSQINKNAKLEKLDKRISHLERARLAIEIGEGAGVVQYQNLWAVAVSGLPKDRPLPIVATPMPEGEFEGRWRSIDIVLDDKASVANSLSTMGIMVDHGQFICSDLEAFGEFKMWESLDGLADFVFWGPDAEGVAKKFNAQALESEEFGWIDVAIDEIGKHAQAVQDYVYEHKLRVGSDYRPHCNLEKLNSQVRNSEIETGEIQLKSSTACGFSNRWGDGIFEVIRDFDSEGNLVRIRLDVGNERRQSVIRGLMTRSQGAIVTQKIVSGGEPIRFAERLEPANPNDSGWAFCSGNESDEYMENSANFAIVRVQSLVDKDPAIAEILDAPIGSLFRRGPNGYEAED